LGTNQRGGNRDAGGTSENKTGKLPSLDWDSAVSKEALVRKGSLKTRGPEEG